MIAGFLFAAAQAAVAPTAPAAADPALERGEREVLLAVQVLAERGRPFREREVDRVRPFYEQRLITEAGIILDLAPAQLEAFRDLHNLSDNNPIVLTEWLALRPEGESAATRHLGFLHCSSRLKLGTGLVSKCFRDTDADGRIDAVARVENNGPPPTGLQFTPIEPVAYRYVQSSRRPPEWNMYVQPGLGIGWTRDRETGRLLFRAQAIAAGMRGNIDPPVEVDPAQLPATFEIAGARVVVSAFDGEEPTVRVETPFTDRPIRLIARERSGVFSGSSRGWRLEISDVPLPGAPPPADAPSGG